MRQRQPERPRGLLVDVWAVSQLVEGLVDRKLEAAGIDPYGWGTLSVIGAFGPLTPSDVALADRPPAHDAARAPPLRSLWIVRGIGVWRVDPARRPWREGRGRADLEALERQLRARRPPCRRRRELRRLREPPLRRPPLTQEYPVARPT